MKKMTTVSRMIVVIAALAIIATYFLPVWAIYLVAPQYPEGLEMNIWLSKITGQVEIINGLNHYIGMKKINAGMFPEFKILPFIIGFFILYGFAVAVTGNRKFLGSYCILFILFAVAALVDFYMWGYDYGHNLDPTAPIQVPGLSYQPPVVGHKRLLNFDAYSYPDTGGWIIVGAALATIMTWFFEWKKNRNVKSDRLDRKPIVIATAVLVLVMASCTPKAEKIDFGKEPCSECRMTIMDKRFGGEIITKRSKVFKFDDAHCMASFLQRGGVDLKDVHQVLFLDYNSGGKSFVSGEQAYFVSGKLLNSPMAGNAAAFATGAAAEIKRVEINGTSANWETLYPLLIK